VQKRVLFDCHSNANRSQLAEAIARVYFEGRVAAFSAEVRPPTSLDEGAAAATAARGHGLHSHHHKALSDVRQVKYDAVVTMEYDEQCSTVHKRHLFCRSIPRTTGSDGFASMCAAIER